MIDLGLFDVMVIGMAQAFALVPGTSRSGATIIAALFLGMGRAHAARFSFLLGSPAIAGAGIFELKDAADSLGASPWGPIIVGTVTAAISGYASIAWLLRFLSKRTLAPFGLYRVALGLLLVILCVTGILAPGSG
jgi:undecaprenyl-diphosphatase